MFIQTNPAFQNSFSGAMSAETALRAWLCLPLRFLPYRAHIFSI
jgi:hypothetical protein